MILVEPENEVKSEDEYEDVDEDNNQEDSGNNDESNEGSDGEGDGEGDGDGEGEDLGLDANLGWADSVAKILRTGKPKGKRTLVLSKAKKLPDILRQKQSEKKVPVPGFQIEGEVKEEKPDPLLLLDVVEPPKKKRKELPKTRVKPGVLDRERERTLAKIATRGVVQLFNAVRDQQKQLQDKLVEAGPLERKKEQVLKSMDKRQFLDVLMGEKARSENVDGPVKSDDEKATPAASTWGVLREDFMMGAKFKDWDKQQEVEESEEST